MTDLTTTLNRLGHARYGRKFLEEQIAKLEAPHLEAAKRASAKFRETLERVKEQEATANKEARSLYSAATEARRAELLAGKETPGIELPPNWSAALRPNVEITNANDIPRALCAPVKSLVNAAVKAGETVPGVELGQQVVFSYKEPK